MSTSDTIVAPATPPGRGAVSILRLSGSRAHAIASQLGVGELVPRVAKYSAFLADNQQAIDVGLCLYFKAPDSFTGEDVVELHGHGGVIVTDSLLQRVLSLGARLAEPGEFAKRAFLNDKMDLTQAEAIADLIDSGSAQAAKLAVRSLQGEFAQTINQLKQQLVDLRLYIEGAIDFVDEDVDWLAHGNVGERLTQLLETLQLIQQQATQGHCLQEGISLVIAGKPNAGKSSLLNRLSGRDSAIVTDIPGTTRDVLREYIHIDGVPLHIIDTAGLRADPGRVEAEGIKRAQLEINQADHVLWVQDSQQPQTHTQIRQALATDGQQTPPVSVVDNKIDQLAKSAFIERAQNGDTVIGLSAKTGEGIDLLCQHLLAIAGYHAQPQGMYLARRRHLTELAAANAALTNAQTQLNQQTGSDLIELIAEELRQAQLALDRITGVSVDLLGEIFSRFCIGK